MLVFVHVANSAGNPVSSVTYGGVTLERVSGGAAIDSAGEAGRTDLFFAGSGLGTGNQTVTVNRANTTDIMYASAATVTALTNTNVTGIVLLEGDGALTVQSVTDGGAPTNSLRYAAAYSGLASPPPAGTGSTLLNSIDFGNYGIALVRETTAGTGARNVGFNNATTDDRAAVHVAVRELWNRTDTQTVGAFTLTGNDATLTKTSPKVITGETGSFTLSGQPASTSAGYRITADLGKFFLPERNIIQQSEQFNDTNNWKVVRANALANNTAAPDGSITAEFIRETATTGTHVLAYEPNNAIPAVVGPASYTFSCHLKANGRNATLNVNGGGGGGSGASGEVLFDLATGGTTTLTAGTITASGATDLGNGWHRCWISFTTTQAGTCRSDVYLYSSSASYTGDGASGIYAWGAQLEQSASLTEYDPTGIGSVTPITFKYNHVLAGGTGAFTLTGLPNTLSKGRSMVGERGSFALTGQPADLRHNPKIDGGVGSFALAGQPADTRHNVVIEGNTGAFSLVGQPATLAKTTAKAITTETGAFTFTGNPATVRRGYALAAEAGAFTATGQPATLRHNPRIEANTGSFVLSGGAPALLRGWYLSGGAGEFIETGQPATFRRTWAVQGGTGTFALTGNSAALTELGAYEIDLIAGSFTLAGQPADLAQGRAMQITVGAFAFTGPPATLRQSQALTAEAESFTATGEPAALTQGHRLEGGTGAFSFTGQPATLTKQSAKQLAADAGALVVAGQPAALSAARVLAPDYGVLALTGQPVTLRHGRTLVVSACGLDLTGNSVALTEGGALQLSADRGAFVLTAPAASLTKPSAERRRNVLIF